MGTMFPFFFLICEKAIPSQMLLKRLENSYYHHIDLYSTCNDWQVYSPINHQVVSEAFQQTLF